MLLKKDQQNYMQERMDSRDLRQGNYIYDKDVPKSISLNDIIFIEYWGRNKGTNPNVPESRFGYIPLTPEWAKDLGFKQFKGRPRTWYLNHFFIYFGKKKGPKMNNRFPLPYVHNLQNLYWEMNKKLLIRMEDEK